MEERLVLLLCPPSPPLKDMFKSQISIGMRSANMNLQQEKALNHEDNVVYAQIVIGPPGSELRIAVA